MGTRLLDERTLENAWVARHGGGKRRGPPLVATGAADPGEEGPQGRFLRLEIVLLLLRALVGCERTLALLLDYFGGRVSCAELAAALGVDRSTAWRWIQRTLVALRKRAAVAQAALGALDRSPGGCTVCPRTTRAVAGIDAWAVSLLGREARLSPLPLAGVAAYVREHEAVLFGPDEVYLGLWFDERAGEWCLDVAKLFPDRAVALAFARLHRQKAITHLGTLQTVWLEEENRKAA